MANESSIEKLKAPKNGITVRMYRPGHGDCFLLALPRENGDDPFYMLIDCGLKPGSQDYIHKKNDQPHCRSYWQVNREPS